MLRQAAKQITNSFGERIQGPANVKKTFVLWSRCRTDEPINWL